ncbi:peptidoglycan DD-metalloendopeptidase family protein [Trinickia caryophylli]|nr:peptidoglycan DD-metalloendopeptidase family protein [Trinickia caryophylli]WQE15419.1 peptidoglycan DD-metalloendopeptidase family protein [Trinickia caryophylli]GLU33846.1 lipoprotein [Trinickia caryophylli]
MMTTTNTTAAVPAIRVRTLTHIALTACIALAAGCTTTDQWFGTSSTGSQSNARLAQPGVQPGYYRVNAGDTLASVAAGFGQRQQDIAEWNRLPMTALLVPGQVLRVVPPTGANASVSGAPAVRLAWPAYGNVLKPTQGAASKAIMIAGRADDPVKAAADGNVIYIGNAVEQYATLIVVKHSDSLVTAYAVNGPVAVKEGDTVRKGQSIAQMGTDKTGRATVQFEIRREGTPMDPLAYLPR